MTSRSRAQRKLPLVDWLIFAGIVVVLIGLVVIAQLKGWVVLVNMGARGGGCCVGIAGSGDEGGHPARNEARLEQDRQTLLPAPAPIAGEDDQDISKGHVRIDIGDR